MNTPLKAEPLKFEWEWCFLYKSLFYAAFQGRIFCFLIGLKNGKCEFCEKPKLKHHFRTTVVWLFKFNCPESHRIFSFFLFRSLVLYLEMRSACVIKFYVIIYSLVANFKTRRTINAFKCLKITLLKKCSYFTPHFLFIINKILCQSMRFLEPNYTYKCKIICYNNSANRFDNFKILMYN